MESYLLVGLGNPGRKYCKTRHNIGFAVLDRLAEIKNFSVSKNKFNAKFALEELFGKKICLIKPQSFMNVSGEVVDAFYNYFKIEDGKHLLVIHDDIDLEEGQMKLSFGSGHAGHNGVRSIFDWLYTKEFYRLRIGVGRPSAEIDPADYVLGKFDDEEMAGTIVEDAVRALEKFYSG